MFYTGTSTRRLPDPAVGRSWEQMMERSKDVRAVGRWSNVFLELNSQPH